MSWCMLFAYGFHINKSKMEYIECKFSKKHTNSNLEIIIGVDIIPQITRIKYLGSIIQYDREIDRDINPVVQTGD